MSTDLLQMKYSHLLSYYEKDELRNYPVIYYMGKRRPKLSGINYNFDDDHGDLKVYAQDQLCYRYEVTSIIGKGSFGQVFRAYDHKNKEEVALKVVKNHSKYTNQALIEVKLLTEVRTMDPNSHYNIVRIK
jgi:dual specificity tyrosine-phosphorylation-regulated kinase 2/3/4